MTRQKPTKPASPEKDATTDADRSYAVGYGKPPEHSRFKPGHPGNPKGRVKGSENFRTVVDDELNRTYAIQIGGKPVKLPAFRAVIRRVVIDALNGDKRAAGVLLNLYAQYGSAAAIDDAKADLPSDDQELLDAFLAEIASDAAAAKRGKKEKKSPATKFSAAPGTAA